MPYKNPEDARKRGARYRATHKKELREKKADYHKAHQQEIIARVLAWQIANPDRFRKRQYAWSQANAAHLHGFHAAWRKANPEKVRAARKRRRAKIMKASINDLSSAQWREMQAAFDHRCAYCSKRSKGKLTQDHILPLIKGGNHTVSNIVPACRICNAKKHTGPPPTPVQPLLLTVAPARPYKGKKL